MIVMLVHGHWPPRLWEYDKGARGWWWLMAEYTQFMTRTTTTTVEQNWGPTLPLQRMFSNEWKTSH